MVVSQNILIQNAVTCYHIDIALVLKAFQNKIIEKHLIFQNFITFSEKRHEENTHFWDILKTF